MPVNQINKNPFGIKNSPLLEQFKDLIQTKKTALDIGCAHGAKSIYLANLGLNVTAIDKDLPSDFSDTRINRLKTDIQDFTFTKYDIILALNVLQFLNKSEQINVLDKIERALNHKGLIFITSFTQHDPSYLNNPHITGQFAPNELSGWATQKHLNILHYSEYLIEDNHTPIGIHHHGIVELVAVKE